MHWKIINLKLNAHQFKVKIIFEMTFQDADIVISTTPFRNIWMNTSRVFNLRHLKCWEKKSSKLTLYHPNSNISSLIELKAVFESVKKFGVHLTKRRMESSSIAFQFANSMRKIRRPLDTLAIPCQRKASAIVHEAEAFQLTKLRLASMWFSSVSPACGLFTS